MIVREAQVSDLPKLIKPAQNFVKEAGISIKIVPEIFKASWTNFINSGIGKIFVCPNGDDHILGAIGGIVSSDPNDGKLTVTEAFWYVSKEDRGRAGLKLFNAYLAWSEKIKAERVVMTLLLSSMPNRLDKFYRKKGFGPLEVQYIKEN